MTLRTGIYGGTFNPVHKGHIHVASLAVETGIVDRVIFVPNFIPPHKDGVLLPHWSDRLAMLELCISEYDQFSISDIEIRRQGRSYTIDTLNAFKKVYGEDLFFIMGADSFAGLTTWKDWEGILSISSIVVVSRPGVPLCSSFPVNQGYVEMEPGCFSHENRKNLYFINSSGVDISSSEVRSLLSTGQETDMMLGYKVSQYIEEKGLYKNG